MAPFWTFFLGYVILGDGISWFEVAALLISFGGVLLIATAEQESDGLNVGMKFGQDGITGLTGMKAQVIGCLLCLLTSWCYSVVVVFTRLM